MSAARPLPVLGSSVLDARGSDRALRVSWHSESDLVVLSLWRDALNTIAGWLGVTGYPPAVLFAVATLFILLVLLHYSTVISRLTDENVDLAQRIALLEERVSRSREPAD